MKIFSLIFIVFLSTACSSLQPIQLSPAQLQEQISQGQLIKKGDDIKVVTVDGKRHELIVTEVNDRQINGNDTSILIAEIVAIETSEFSAGKTALLAGGTVFIYQLMAAIALVSIM